MPTFTQIGSAVTVGAGGAASIDFTSIPSTYTDLILKYSVRGNNTSGSQMVIAINGSTSSYSDKLLEGNGTSASSYNNAGGTGTGIFAGSLVANTQTASTFNSGEIFIPNYAGSTNKSVSIDYVTENNATTSYTDFTAGLWSNTSAITSLSLKPASGSFVQYSTAYLYGVSNA